MIELMKFAIESPTHYISTLIMLLGIAGLIAGTINVIIKQITTSAVGIIIALKAKIETKVNLDE